MHSCAFLLASLLRVLVSLRFTTCHWNTRLGLGTSAAHASCFIRTRLCLFHNAILKFLRCEDNAAVFLSKYGKRKTQVNRFDRLPGLLVDRLEKMQVDRLEYNMQLWKISARLSNFS